MPGSEIRSFIAVDPSTEVSGAISDLIGRLEGETRGFRWVRSEGLHLTLRFLGEVDPSVLDTVGERLEKIAANLPPARLQAKGVGFFPSAERARVVWVGLEGETDRLVSLQSAVEQVLEGLPVHREERRAFTPHLTIARVKDFRTATGVARILQNSQEADFGEFSVESLVLYKSNLTPQGARYTKLKEFKLGR